MKYCPYCGAEILSAPFLFAHPAGSPCRCWRSPPLKKLRESPRPRGRRQKKERPRKRERPPRKAKQLILSEVEALDCDGYYEDVQPIDADRQREGVDTRLICEWCCWWLGWALVIGGCVAALFCCESCKQSASSVKYR